jgi:sterol desaturase/sphingolipid hydroxylase (fatty acid hydroxylase superfamily)
MNEAEIAAKSGGLIFNEVLFGLAILAFFFLLMLEKKKPLRTFSSKVYKESFVTNTMAFVINNVIITTLRASSLFLVAQQFSTYGLLSGLSDGPIKWILAFAFFDLAIYVWHYIATNLNLYGVFIKSITVTKASMYPPVFDFTFLIYSLKLYTNASLLSLLV